MPRYRFQDFVLSPRRRTLTRDGREVPLIPRYYDLLVFLVERRGQAVQRQEIFDHVWHDVVVSDSALSQAIRTIRRVLDDDSREPRFVRTVSRHGYRFVFEQVVEEDEGDTAIADHAATITDQSPAISQDKIVLPGLERPLWVKGAIGGGGAGLAAGGVGAVLLTIVPDSEASMSVVPVLALLGAICGAAGGAGVSAGIALMPRLPILGATLGGGLVGLTAQLLGHATLKTIAGLDVKVGGLMQGLVIGAACGVAPSALRWGRRHSVADAAADRLAVSVSVFAICCGLATLALVLAGQPLIGGTLHAISQASAGAQTTLAPLGRLLGEQDFGPLTAAIIGTGEGLLFGAGLALGLTNRRHESSKSTNTH